MQSVVLVFAFRDHHFGVVLTTPSPNAKGACRVAEVGDPDNKVLNLCIDVRFPLQIPDITHAGHIQPLLCHLHWLLRVYWI